MTRPTAEEIAAAREWMRDCAFGDEDANMPARSSIPVILAALDALEREIEIEREIVQAPCAGCGRRVDPMTMRHIGLDFYCPACADAKERP